MNVNEGMDFYFKHARGRTTLVLADDTIGSHAPLPRNPVVRSTDCIDIPRLYDFVYLFASSASMCPHLTPLPATLMRNLGRTGSLDDLAKLLASKGIAPDQLRQPHNGKPYRVSLAPHGIDVMLQCTNPEAAQDQWQWGLHSLTLHTAASNPANHWTQPWPKGLDPEQARTADVVRLLAADPEEAMITPNLVCFAIDGMDGLSWALMAIFDPGSLKLQTLTLQRSGEWTADAELKIAAASAADTEAHG